MKIKYSGILSPKAQRISNAVSVVANIAKHPIDFSIEDLKEPDSTEFNSQEEIQYLLHEIKSEKPHFQNVIDSRIIRPSGAFCLYGIDGNKSIPASLDFGYKMNIINKVQEQTAVEDLINDCFVIFAYLPNPIPHLRSPKRDLSNGFAGARATVLGPGAVAASLSEPDTIR